MLNFSPIGRNCSQEERDEFGKYDKVHGIRDKFVNELRKRFQSSFGLEFSIGGEISIDCYPLGGDKRACLKHLEDKFSTIYFFGDRTEKGGNDFEIYEDHRTLGHKVGSPVETIALINRLFLNEQNN